MDEFSDWDYEMLLGRSEVMYQRGYMDRYQEIVNSGRGPNFRWMRELDTHLQLWREAVEARMDAETRARFLFWLDQEDGQDERRRCQAFMLGIWYEREHPGEWKF